MIKDLQIQSKQDVLTSIKDGDRLILNQLYNNYRMDFMRFGKRYIQDEAAILDTYQDAFIVFFENVQLGKLMNLQSTIKTYIFSIGKFMLIKKFKDSIKEIPTESIETLTLTQDEIQDKLELTHQQQQIADAINELSEGCKKMLILFYYKRYSTEAIQQALQFKNTNVVKSKKKRCLNYLKKIIVERYSDLY